VKKKIIFIIFAMLILYSAVPSAIRASSDKGIYIIPVKGEIGPAMTSFISDQLQKAKEVKSDIIVLDINTFGGRVSDTIKIQELVKEYRQNFVFYTFVNNKAESAGVMITLLGDKIYMTPDASIGSAAVIPYNEKSNSAWAAMLRGQAESKGRRGDIAQGTADYDMTINGIKGKGKLINLTSEEAIKLGYCDKVIKDVNELIKDSGYRGNTIIYGEKDTRHRIAEMISNSYVSALLLLIGIAALIIEAFVPSFGIAGTIGVVCVVLYFLGNIFTGNTGWWALIIFVLGMVFLIIEALIPGFGISGIAGLLGISTAIVISAGSLQSGLIMLLAAWVVVVVTVFILFKYGMNLGFLSKIILKTEQNKDKGYKVNEFNEMLNKEGIALSQLRPSGVGDIEGKRYDIQTEGEFLKKGTHIVVSRVEGNKIFVKEKGEI
jgi:membrane-bound serine protease (ClpP class)